MKKTIFVALVALSACFAQTTNGQDISLDEDTGVLTIDGSRDHDDCQISVFDDNDDDEQRLRLEVTILTTESDGDTDHVDETYDVDEVSLIVFYGNNGNDRFEVVDHDFMELMNIDIPMYLYGGRGLDRLSGGPSDDVLVGGEGFDGRRDELTGNGGKDIFYTPFVIKRYKEIVKKHRNRKITIRVPLKTYEDRLMDFNQREGDSRIQDDLMAGS